MEETNGNQATNGIVKGKKNVFVYEDKEYHSSMLDNLNMLRKNRQFCDVILQVGINQDIHEIYAHKVVLSSASPYFLEMFSNDGMINYNGASVPASTAPLQYRLVNNGGIATTGSKKNSTARHEFDPDAFDQVIDYAYTARLEIPAEKVREIYAIASRLKMTSVASKCGKFLLSTLTPDNCLEVRNMKAVLKDPFLLQSVDGYIKQNFEQIVQNKACITHEVLQHLKVEFLLSSEQDDKVNERHVFNEVLEWIHDCFLNGSLDMATLLERKLIMLFYNKNLNQIQDCSEMVEPEQTAAELDAIEDYKKLSKRLSHPTLTRSASVSTDNLNGGNGNGASNGKVMVPSKPRQFMFARSDSESSLSSLADNDDEQEWKLLANCRIGEHNLAGLVTIAGQLCLISMKLRISSKCSSKDNLCDGSDYCLIPPMSSPRCAVGTAELGGKLFVCGGYDRGECLKTVEVYDTVTNKWEKLQHMQVPRGRFAIAVANGNVYAVGGCDGQNELNSAEFYDSLTLKWKLIQSAPVVRSNAGVCSMQSKIFVIGGWSGNRGLTRCDMYDPDVGQWSEIGHLNTGRYQTAVCMLNDVIYAVGGCDSWSCLNSVEAYIHDTWKVVAFLQTARRGCGVATYNGKIYAVGGSDGVQALCSVEVYDPVENRWTFGKPMTTARANVGVAVVGSRLYAVGGFSGKAFLNSVEFFDFETEEWTTSVIVNESDREEKLINGAPNEHMTNGSVLAGNVNADVAENGRHDRTTSENGSSGGGGLNGSNSCSSMHKNSLSCKAPLRNSLSSEPLVEVEETIVGH